MAEPRPRGLSVRWQLTLSYAGFLIVAGILLLAVVWIFLLRYVPNVPISAPDGFVPNRSDLQRAFFPAAAATLGFLLVVGLAGGWFLAGRMLTPLERITRAARAVSAGEFSHRIRMSGRQDEIRELADVFDAMLTRVEAHVAEQQRFAANASHELRTPLAITQAVLDVAQREPDREHSADLAQLRAVNDRAIALTEALLLLSRAGNEIRDVEPVDLSLLAEDAVETLLPFAESRGIDVEFDTQPATALGSPVLLSQVVTNLVHNAIVHNLPAGGSLRVRTGRQPAPGGTGPWAWVSVENTGPVISPEAVATLTEPFQRGGRRTRDSSHAGVGLGLAIVARIIDTHRGRLTLTPLAGGGLRVDVGLPAAHQPVQGRSIADRGTDAQLPVAIPRPGSDDQPDQLAE